MKWLLMLFFVNQPATQAEFETWEACARALTVIRADAQEHLPWDGKMLAGYCFPKGEAGKALPPSRTSAG